MIDRSALLKDCQRQVSILEDDLRKRAADPDAGFAERLRAEWRDAYARERIAADYDTWLDGQVTQAAVAWVLATVFLRFCEDNGLIEDPYLSGPGQRARIAAERQEEYLHTEEHAHEADRGWILAGIEALSTAAPGTEIVAKLFDRAHNPMWRITPSDDGAKKLVEFWRRRDESGEVVHDFTDGEWNTRFLGDLYQELSESARKTYALLQTPEFIERFILKYTLDPAIEEFGLEPDNEIGDAGLRVIDPACGSGHFLLGAFERLADAWARYAPTLTPDQQVARALASVHGVDKNPFAVSIARFRLLLAAMKRLEIHSLSGLGDFVINVAVGDSLLHGRGAPGQARTLDDELQEPHHFVTEDVTEYHRSCDILGVGSYHVAVGNPPYITPKDKAENLNYRVYKSCSGKYALSVPFAERMFHLAKVANADGRASGYVGQITANSFMKREFGKKLIEEFFARKQLTYIIDTSGAHIPGHGTPTVILIGRNVFPLERQTIRAVLGIRGEPALPADPEKGHVWQAIASQVDCPGSESEWIGAVDLERSTAREFPWSLSGGGAGDLAAHIAGAKKNLAGRIDGSIGFLDITGDDEIFVAPRILPSWRVAEVEAKDFVIGDGVRDWSMRSTYVLWPYQGHRPIASLQWMPFLWRYREVLRSGLTFGKTRELRGMAWHEHTMLSWSRCDCPTIIAFAEVATHNHFVLDRHRKVFKQTAPVIKLSEGVSEDEHLALLGVLNSSIACFWLKQSCHVKGGSGIGRGVQDEAWEDRYAFNGSRVEQFPLPADLPIELGRVLDRLARELSAVEPSAVCAEGMPSRERLNVARTEHEQIRARMIALQEELDWDVYRRYGLISEDDAAELVADSDDVPLLELGERAFEIVLARRMAAGDVETQWFARHGSTPITKIPTQWPEAYQRVVEARIRAIENRTRDIGLIERPECKRRWQSEPWEKKEKEALRGWLLDRCEDRALWFDEAGRPRALTVNRLADLLRADPDVVSVAALYAGVDTDPATVLAEIIADEHVPFLAAYRYKEAGLRKREQWERTWERQREEDRTGTRLDIPVPPKYASADFTKTSYWRNRGKLDVAKERFISYPGASPETDPSLMLAWAGFDHAQQAHVLIELIDARALSGPDPDRLTPLIAGLKELMPWIRQWHGERDAEFGTSPADDYAAALEGYKSTHGLSDADLDAWRPSATRTRRSRTATPYPRSSSRATLDDVVE